MLGGDKELRGWSRACEVLGSSQLHFEIIFRGGVHPRLCSGTRLLLGGFPSKKGQARKGLSRRAAVFVWKCQSVGNGLGLGVVRA